MHFKDIENPKKRKATHGQRGAKVKSRRSNRPSGQFRQKESHGKIDSGLFCYVFFLSCALHLPQIAHTTQDESRDRSSLLSHFYIVSTKSSSIYIQLQQTTRHWGLKQSWVKSLQMFGEGRSTTWKFLKTKRLSHSDTFLWVNETNSRYFPLTHYGLCKIKLCMCYLEHVEWLSTESMMWHFFCGSDIKQALNTTFM